VNTARFEELAAALLDGSISPSEREELLSIAQSDSSCGRALIELLRLEPLLRDSLAQDSTGFPRRVLSALKANKDSSVFATAVVAKLKVTESHGLRVRSTRSWRPFATAAVLLLVAGIAILLLSPNAPLARLDVLKGSVLLTEAARETAVTRLMDVYPGQGLRCEEGSARVTFQDGSTIQLESGTVIQSLTNIHRSERGNVVVLQKGEIVADVTPQRAGTSFHVITPTAKINVIGTRFTVSSAPESTRLQVHEGKVELKRALDGASVDVPAGYYALATPKQELAAKPIPPRDSRPEDQEAVLTALSYLGGPGEDSVVGVAIQDDGTVVLAANLSAPEWGEKKPLLAGGVQESATGVVVRLSATGRTLLSLTRVASALHDMALDDSGALYLAAGAEGVIKLNASADRVEWKRTSDMPCLRVDAGSDGTVAALLENSERSGRIQLFAPDGTAAATIPAPFNPSDVAIDARRKLVFVCGARSGNTARKEIGSVAYLNAYALDGREAWRNYGFDPATPTTFASHTSGERIALGRDGNLYGAFLSVGGSHIFSRHPRSLEESSRLRGNDAYNQGYSTGNTHISFVARFEPETGELLAGQLLLGRDADGKATRVTPVGGGLAADENGRVYFVGKAHGGGPLSHNAIGTNDYSGQEGFLCIFTPDLKQREFFSTFNAEAYGGSALHAVAAQHGGYALGGRVDIKSKIKVFDPIQADGDAGAEGFFAVKKSGKGDF
jgi:hypothetical protein